MQNPDDILKFWYEETESKQKFSKDPNFDALIKNRFHDEINAALAGELKEWEDTRTGRVALIIILDQFTRNVFRDTAQAFSGDGYALELCFLATEKGDLEKGSLSENITILMPMMHSEELSVQDASLPLFEKYGNADVLKYAHLHRDIIVRFGRFPHRNDILKRESSKEELAFLKEPNSSF